MHGLCDKSDRTCIAASKAYRYRIEQCVVEQSGKAAGGDPEILCEKLG